MKQNAFLKVSNNIRLYLYTISIFLVFCGVIVSASQVNAESPATTSSYVDDGGVSGYGDDNGFETKVGTAPYASANGDGNYMWSDITGDGNGSGCFNTDKDVHYFDFNMTGVPDGATITGIKVYTNMWVNATSATPGVCASIMEVGTYGDSTTYATQGAIGISATSDTNVYQTFGGEADLWNKSLSVSDIKGDNRLRVYLSMQSDNGTRDFYIDHIYVEVYYTEVVVPTQTISGTVYDTDGETPLPNKTVNIKVNGAGSYTPQDTDGSGNYSFVNVEANAGDILTIYLDGEAQYATTVTTASELDLTEVNLYSGTVVVRSDDSTSITNAEIVASGYDSTDDTDVRYSFSSNVISLTSGMSLAVWSDITYAPGANVNVTNGDVSIVGTLNLASSTLTLNTGGITLLGGTLSGGAVTLLGDTDINSNFSFATLNLGNDIASGTTYANSNFTASQLVANTNHIFNASTYTITINSTGGAQGFIVDTLASFEANESTIKYMNGAFAETTYYNLECAGSVACVPDAGSTTTIENDLIIASTVGAVEFITTANTSFIVGGNVTIASGATFKAPDTLRIGGSFTNNGGTFTHMSSTVEFNGSGTQTITPGSSSFNNVTFSGSGTYALAANTTIAGTATLTSGTLEPSGYALTVATLTINGGTLQMDTSGDTLKVGTALSMSSGSIVASDVATAPVIMTSGSVGTDVYSVSFTGGTLGVDELSINSVNASGIVVGSSVAITNFNKVTLGENFGLSAEDVMLDITSQTKTLLDWVFPTNTAGRDINVRAKTSGTITMQNATGAFSGEDYDSDNGGTVTWGVTVSLSGTLYSDAGVTAVNCSLANRTIAVSVAGGAPTTATCSAVGGTFTVPGLTMAVGNILTVFVDGHANNAVTVLRTNSSEAPLTLIDLYEHNVILRHEDSTPITIADLADYDATDQNGDIPFTVSDGDLTVSSGTLYINAGDTFTPGGDMTLGGLYIAPGAFLNATTTEAYSVSGDFTNDGTFNAASSTVTLTDYSLNVTTSNSPFYNLIVDVGEEAVSMLDDLYVDNSLTITSGTFYTEVDVNVGTAGGSGSITGAGIYSQQSGTTVVLGSGNITQSSGTYQFGNLTLGDGTNTKTTTIEGATIYIFGDLTVNANHTLNGSGSMVVTQSITGNGIISMTGGSVSQWVNTTRTFGNNTTAWSFNDLTLTRSSGTAVINATGGSTQITVAGTLTVAANTTLQAGARTWELTNTNLAKPLVVGGTFTSGTSTVVYSGDNDAGTVTIDDVTYYNLTLGGAVLEDYDAEGDLTVQNDLSVNANATLKGTDNWTVNGSATGAGVINLTGGVFAQVVAANETLGTTSGANDWTFFNLTIENSASAPTVTLSANGDTPGEIIVSGTFTIGNASDTSATTVDVNTNDRVIDANGAVTITSKGVLSASNSALFTVAGDWTNNGTFTHNSGTVTFDASDAGNTLSGTLTGSSAFYNLTFNNASGAWSTAVSLSVDNNLTITAGTFTGPALGVDQSALALALVSNPSSVNTLTVAGNFTNSGTFTHNDGLIKFTATDPGNTISFGASEASSVWFSGVDGEWSFEGDNELSMYNLIIQYGSVDSAIDLRVTSGLGGLSSNVGTLNITNPVDFEWDIASSGTKGSSNFDTNWTFYNLIFSNSSGSPITITSGWSAGSTITINGQMTVGDAGDTSTTALTLGAQTWVFTGSDPIALSTNPVATFDPGTSTIKYTGSGTVVLNDRVDYYNLTLDGAGTYQPPVGGDGALIVENDLSVTTGTLDLNTNDPSLTVAGDITIDGTLQASNSSNLIVTGTWTHNSVGGFVANGGTVVFTGGAQSDITGIQPTTFYNFTVDTAGKTVRFKKEQQVTFGGTLTAQGNNLNRIIFQSTSTTNTLSTDQWLMNLTGDTDLTWVIVVNGGCVGGSNAVQANQTLVNGGNNDVSCWPFVNIGIQYLFAPGDGNGGGTPVFGGGGGGGSTGGSADASGGEEGVDGGGTPVDGGGDDGGTAPSP